MDKTYKFQVHPGNNSAVVKAALSRRGNWEEVLETDKGAWKCHMIWKQINFTRQIKNRDLISQNEKDMQIFINHFDTTRNLCTKTGLVRSLRSYYQNHEQSCKIFQKRKEKKSQKRSLSEKSPWMFYFYLMLFNISMLKLRGICPFLVEVNFICEFIKQRSIFMTLHKTDINRYTFYNTMAPSFILTAKVHDQEFFNFKKCYDQCAKKETGRLKMAPWMMEKNTWLIKPANLNQGRGIEIFSSLSDAVYFLDTRVQNTMWLAQKYVEKPLLYHGRKFDIRVWVLVTSSYDIYFYKRAYMRTSSDNYSLDNPNNYVHLTNNCLQKHGDNYGAHEPGNTLPWEILQDYISGLFPNIEFDMERDVISRCTDLIIDTIMSVKKELNTLKRKDVFELFGYDFLIDENLRTWLIEVNVNPYLGIPNEFIQELLPKMLDDMFRITLDGPFPPAQPIERPNDFKLIFSEKTGVNLRRSFATSIYPHEEVLPNLKFLTIGRGRKTLGQSSKKNREEKNSIEFAEEGIGEKETKENSNKKAVGGSKTQGKREEFIKNNLEDVVKEILTMLPAREKYQPNVNEKLFQDGVLRICRGLENWELESDINIEECLKALKMISHSPRAKDVILEEGCLKALMNILDDLNTRVDVQAVAVDAITQMVGSLSNKLRISEHFQFLAHKLTLLAIKACSSELANEIPLSFFEQCAECLITLDGGFNRKIFIPGETRENTTLREAFVECGGLFTMVVLTKFGVDPKIRMLPEKLFKSYCEEDWQLQIKALESPTFNEKVPSKLIEFMNQDDLCIFSKAKIAKMKKRKESRLEKERRKEEEDKQAREEYDKKKMDETKDSLNAYFGRLAKQAGKRKKQEEIQKKIYEKERLAAAERMEHKKKELEEKIKEHERRKKAEQKKNEEMQMMSQQAIELAAKSRKAQLAQISIIREKKKSNSTIKRHLDGDVYFKGEKTQDAGKENTFKGILKTIGESNEEEKEQKNTNELIIKSIEKFTENEEKKSHKNSEILNQSHQSAANQKTEALGQSGLHGPNDNNEPELKKTKNELKTHSEIKLPVSRGSENKQEIKREIVAFKINKKRGRPTSQSKNHPANNNSINSMSGSIKRTQNNTTKLKSVKNNGVHTKMSPNCETVEEGLRIKEEEAKKGRNGKSMLNFDTQLINLVRSQPKGSKISEMIKTYCNYSMKNVASGQSKRLRSPRDIK